MLYLSNFNTFNNYSESCEIRGVALPGHIFNALCLACVSLRIIRLL